MGLALTIINSIIKGIPLVGSIKELIAPKKVSVPVTDISGNNTTPKVVEVDPSPFIQKVIMLLIEGGSVWGVVYLMKHFGLTYNDIINLFGLIHG